MHHDQRHASYGDPMMSRNWLGRTGTVTMPMGEIADRLSIALLKIVNAQPTGDKLGYQLHDIGQYSAAWLLALDQLKDETRIDAITAYEKLSDSNRRLWAAEDAIRIVRAGGNDSETLKLAVTIAATNDERFAHKAEINSLFGQSGDLKSYRKGNDATAQPNAIGSDAK